MSRIVGGEAGVIIRFKEDFDLPVEEVYGYFQTPADWTRLYGTFGEVEDRGEGWFAVPLKGFPFPLVARVTDVFSLDATSADELRWSAQPRALFSHHRAEDIGPQVLVRLAELLGVGTAASLAGGFSLLAGESQQSPWVVSLPPELVEGIGALEDDEIEPLVNRWRRPNELATAVAPAALADYLRGLSRFLRSHDGPFVLFIHTATGDR